MNCSFRTPSVDTSMSLFSSVTVSTSSSFTLPEHVSLIQFLLESRTGKILMETATQIFQMSWDKWCIHSQTLCRKICGIWKCPIVVIRSAVIPQFQFFHHCFDLVFSFKNCKHHTPSQDLFKWEKSDRYANFTNKRKKIIQTIAEVKLLTHKN